MFIISFGTPELKENFTLQQFILLFIIITLLSLHHEILRLCPAYYIIDMCEHCEL